MVELYHYTCEHGRAGLGEEGTLLPLAQRESLRAGGMPPVIQEVAQFIWLTDLDFPFRAALGLTSRLLRCDRTRYRYRVRSGDAVPWMRAREDCTPAMVEALETAYGVMPVHWWIATTPVRVLYTPIEGKPA